VALVFVLIINIVSFGEGQLSELVRGMCPKTVNPAGDETYKLIPEDSDIEKKMKLEMELCSKAMPGACLYALDWDQLLKDKVTKVKCIKIGGLPATGPHSSGGKCCVPQDFKVSDETSSTTTTTSTTTSTTTTARPGKNVDIDWEIPLEQGKTFEPVTKCVSVGDTVTFKWDGQKFHNVFELKNRKEWDDCDPIAITNTDVSSETRFIFEATKEGTFFFVCGVADHCRVKKQKAIIQVEENC